MYALFPDAQEVMQRLTILIAHNVSYKIINIIISGGWI